MQPMRSLGLQNSKTPIKTLNYCAGIELTTFVTEGVRSTTAPRPHGRDEPKRNAILRKETKGTKKDALI